MSDTIVLAAVARSDEGKGASRRLRRLEGLMPGVVYGAGKAAVSVSIPHKDVIKAAESDAFYSQVLSLEIDGKAEDVVVKALQRHPSKPFILHADFLRVKKGQALTVTVPLHFINDKEAPGTVAGGELIRLSSEVEIIAKPKDLPEFIEVDLSGVELDQTVHLSDITLPKGVEIKALQTEGRDDGIASIQAPKAVAEEAPAEEAGDEAGDEAASDEAEGDSE